MPLRRLFAASSVLFLLVLAISPAKNALRSYRSLQRQYRKLASSRAHSLKAAQGYQARPVAIQQIWLRDFENRVDRCTTCHLGVADPLMAGAPRPFGLHPGTPHTPEAFDRFGCTSCHGGQGLATTQADAHGTAADAGPPMTPPASIEAGCGRCHLSESVAGAPVLSRGRALIARAGLLRLPRRARAGRVPLGGPAARDPPAQDRRRVGEALAEGSEVDRPERHDAQLPPHRSGDRRALAFPLRRPGAEGPRGPDRSRGGRAARQPRERQEARVGVAVHHLSHRRRKGKGLGARALEDRLHRVARLAARVSARAAGLQPAHRDAALSLQRNRVARRRRLPGGGVPRLRRPEGDSRAASREPESRRERPQALPALRLLLLSRPGRIGVGEVRAGAGRDRRQEGPVARLRAPHRPRAHAPGVARREARVAALVRRRSEDAFLRLQRRRLPRRHTALLALGAQPVPDRYRYAPPQKPALLPGRTGRRPHPELPLPLLPPDRRPGRRRLDRPAHLRGKQGQARLARRLPDALLHVAADPRGTNARPENAERRRDAARRRAAELLRRSVDPRGPVRRPSGVGRRPRRGPAALRGPRMPGLSHPRIVGRLLRAPA